MNASFPFGLNGERRSSRAVTLVELLACPTKPPGRRRSSRAFTLVELLAVVAIIGILMAVAIPGIRGLTRGSNMSSALTTLRSTLSMARQYAITQRTTVHVVFPHRTTILSNASDADLSKALRSYSVCTDTEYISDWRFLPNGVLFAPDKTDSKNGQVDPDKSIFSVTSLTKVPFPDKSGTVVDMHCLTFNPDGSTKRDTETEIYLNEGSLPVNPKQIKTVAPLYTATNLWSIAVNPIIGRPGRARDYSK